MAKARALIVIDVNRNGLSLCASKLTNPVVFEFPAKAIQDLEVVDATSLAIAVKGFVSQCQLPVSDVVLVLSSDICFEKDLDSIVESDLPGVIQRFVDTVPVASVSSKTFRFQNNRRLIVINRRFYEVLNDALSDLGFSVIAVVPGFALGELGIKTFDASACRLLLKKIDFLKDNSFISPPSLENFSAKKEHFVKSNQKLLVLFFIIAIIFLGLTLYLTLRRPTPAAPVVTTQATPPRPTVEPTTEATPVPQLTGLTVQILNGSGVGGAATELQTQLESLGLTQFTLGNATAVPASTLIIFKPEVTQDARNRVIDIVAETGPVSSQENPTGQFDISITLVQNTP